MDLKKVGQLDELHYTKWFSEVLRKNYAELELKNKEQQYLMMQKDIENAKLRSEIFKLQQIKHAKETVASVAAGYEKLKKELSEKFMEEGVLSDKHLIDDISYEIFLQNS